MGYSTRYFVATPSGRVEKISAARLMRVWFRGERWPEYAGQELKLLEVAVEVDHPVHRRVGARVQRPPKQRGSLAWVGRLSQR